MVQALHIRDWDQRYEVNKDGGSFKGGRQVKKTSPLEFVKLRAFGLTHGEGWRALQRAAGPQRTCRVYGLFCKMLEVAGQKDSDYRGWVLTGNNEVMWAELLADKLGFDAGQVAEDLHSLYIVGWIEIADCPFAVEPPKTVIPAVETFFSDRSEFSATSPRTSAPSERNRNRNENRTKTLTEPLGADGEPVSFDNDRSGQRHRTAADSDSGRRRDIGRLGIDEGDLTQQASETLGGSDCSFPADSDSEFGGSELEPSGQADACSGSASADSGLEPSDFGYSEDSVFGAGEAAIRGRQAALPLPRAATKTQGNDRGPPGSLQISAQSKEAAVFEAFCMLESCFPSLRSRDSKQGRADFTTVQVALEAGFDQGGVPLVEKLVKLAWQKKNARGVRYPLPTWVAAVKKSNVLSPCPWQSGKRKAGI